MELVQPDWAVDGRLFYFCRSRLKLYAAEELELSQRLKVLAKNTGRKIVILHRHPMITSARKMKLYTPREHLRFFLRTILNRRRMLGSPEEAHLWYDGRR
jgi:hypothetical protein